MTLKKQQIDWDSLGFEPLHTRSMWKGECSTGEEWIDGNLVPYGEVNLSPAA